MNRKTICDVRNDLRILKDKARVQHIADVRRAEGAEKEAIKQRFRADAYEAALVALVNDMKRLGLGVSVKTPQ